MAIDFKKNEFHLYNNDMSYIIAISRQMDLMNLYYGARIDAEDVKLQTRTHNVACNADDRMYVSEDKTKVLVYYVVKEARPENEAVYLKIKGLDEKAKYSVNGEIKSGRTLMNYGIVIDNVERDGDNMIFELEAV